MSGYHATSTVISIACVIIVPLIATADVNWTQEASQENRKVTLSMSNLGFFIVWTFLNAYGRKTANVKSVPLDMK